jgi:hypothetical protein
MSSEISSYNAVLKCITDFKLKIIKVKVNGTVLVLFSKEHHAMKAYRGVEV